MSELQQQRHKTPLELRRPRELIVALPPMQSHVNISRIARAAGCFGVTKLIACGNAKVDVKIARDAATTVQLEIHRSLPAVLKALQSQNYRLVGLEQTTESKSLFRFEFQRRTALVVGHERTGLTANVLPMLDDFVEIPIYGLPHSHNAATAASIAIYEYCRQFPDG